MLTAPTFAAALVSGLRAHGHRPSGPEGRPWSAVADEARTLALGLVEAGVVPGTAIAVRPGGATPAGVLATEVAVLAAGAALALDGAVADVTIDGDTVRGLGDDRPVATLRAAGADLGRRRPAAHEERLAAVEPGDVALVGDGTATTHAQAVWALRSVAAWVGPVVPDGPRAVLAPPAAGATVAGALVGRWWPAAAGAALVVGADPVEAARAARPDVVVGDAATWDALVDAVRAEAGRSRSGTGLLRRGRAVVAGEAATRVGRAGRGLAARRAGDRLRAAAGLDALAVGICLGPLAVATGRDLAAAGLPVVATWIDPLVPAPVAAGPVARPTPSEPWGRPLPGRTVEVGPPAVVHGGDVAPGGVPTGPVVVDERGRVRLPRTAARVGA
ncbi:MAG TPA: hypothetical protein VFU19_19645 [Iamia sp.]|nr:hypothetical protein [Iamia sp.]